MRNDNKAELQHYVPKFLLRAHAREETDKVWCFDKSNDNTFCTNLANVLAGTRFNEIEIDGQMVSLEDGLTKLEDAAAPVIARVVERRTLHDLTEKDLAAVASFCGAQFIRTQGFREQLRDTHDALRKALKDRGMDIDQHPQLGKPSDEEIKLSAFRMLVKAPETYGPHFLIKHWHLIESRAEDPFQLGDHPIVVDSNQTITGHRECGVSSPGVSVYLPLCPTLCLCMTDPALVEELRQKADAINRNHRELTRAASRLELTAERVAAFKVSKKLRDETNSQVNPLMDGTPTVYDPRVTLRVNALQMFFASRWIVSSRPDFSTPKQMIADNEDVRRRPQIHVE